MDRAPPRGDSHAFDATDGSDSLGFALQDALAQARFAARDDEAAAREANAMVRHGLDKGCIRYDDYREWRKKNPAVFTAVVDRKNRLIGFFDVFPLRAATAEELIAGQRSERSLGLDDIVPAEENLRVQHIYVATVMYNARHPEFGALVAKDVTMVKLHEHITGTFGDLGARCILAFGHTRPGQATLKRFGFVEILPSHRNRQRDPLYRLPSGAMGTLERRFAGIRKLAGASPDARPRRAAAGSKARSAAKESAGADPAER
ncbi:hypothetical protein [Oleiharenicola sp. Vm1]|uniref:hypothetical protein n=1 Tax=Oleiharenicola sp. Vm1 TaxID=3398393 RepID=UPI0039F4BC33